MKTPKTTKKDIDVDCLTTALFHLRILPGISPLLLLLPYCCAIKMLEYKGSLRYKRANMPLLPAPALRWLHLPHCHRSGTTKTHKLAFFFTLYTLPTGVLYMPYLSIAFRITDIMSRVYLPMVHHHRQQLIQIASRRSLLRLPTRNTLSCYRRFPLRTGGIRRHI